ncbi:MAG: S8 family serine peptidase [Chloroflexi bacterium]|nr:S8 family serine peptidase [Chloroflexota bacterium]
MPVDISPSWMPRDSDTFEPTEPIDPELFRALLDAESDDKYIRVIVYLEGQTDLDAAANKATSVADTRVRIVSALQAEADRSQAPLLAYLKGAQAAGLVDSYTPFWIFNGIAVRARASLVHALVTHPTVASIRMDHWRQWIPDEPANLQTTNSHSLNSPEWGITRIRADQVWTSLHISGTGAVVAGMDTGVDWMHPALQASYRGYNPHGPANHTYSWYDATGGDALYPVDAHGHGSHTMGSIVGQNGIGVAPGARWIAVKMLDNMGYGLDSWIHEAFQWILAPGGDPTRAPDVVNNSWGSHISTRTEFQLDLQALRAANIFAVFSSGNNGPSKGSVGSPASLPEAFAVGATDSDDEIASFSSRGPSPWEEIRPHVAAPGVHVRSSLPGGAYGLANGTSMAAPHVAGIATLLRAVSPTLSITHTAFLITSTAVPLTDSVPNNDSGWGRVDAFAAVVALARPSLITGTVTRIGDNAPIVGALVVATHQVDVGGGQATTDNDGSYLLALAPNTYDLSVSAFGYEPAEIQGIAATTGTSTVADFSLTPLPSGSLRTHITDAATGESVTATITVLDTPLQATDDVYTFTLPEGTYTIRAHALGYRVVTTTAPVAAEQVTVANLVLPTAPSILLIDSGGWYYESQADYFCQALDDLRYAYDEWTVKYLPDDVPAAPDLATYDVVIWSAPADAPGYIGAEDTIISYLSAGGRLLLSGQDVGLLDGGGLWSYWSTYYGQYLKARYLSDKASTQVLEGVEDDIFAGTIITITGPDGADNQDYPDEIEVADPDAAAPLLTYQEGNYGGLRVGTCLDYRAIYLSFGFEAINSRIARRDMMNRSLNWLTSPLSTVGIELQPAFQLSVGPPNTIVTHTLRVRHVGQGGITDTVTLALDGETWETQLGASSLSLSPCTSATVVITVTIPPTAGWDARDAVTVTAQSSLSPTLIQAAVLATKAPAPILLVDDERWYNLEYNYETALTNAGLAYDYWRTGWSSQQAPWGSPTLEMLQQYPLVVWFTGYDWYEPVTDDEAAMLVTYLDGGGRLFLSSQDLLYYHQDTPFSQNYLGVVNYTDSVTPTMASGIPDNPIGDRLGPFILDYPFLNWSDVLVPTLNASVSFYDQNHLPIALMRQAENYKTAFFSFPFETLPKVGRAEVVERVVGWLSWLGNSTFSVDQETVTGGDTLTYTIVLRNDGPETVSTSLSNTLPLSLTLVPGSLTGPAAYHTPTQKVSWQGQLAPSATITCTYRVTVAAGIPTDTLVVNTARLELEDQAIRFDRDAVVRVGAPDLSPSALRCNPPLPRPGTVVTCTLAIANAGPGDAAQAMAINPLPKDTTLVTGSLTLSGAGTAVIPIGTVQMPTTGTIEWTGPLAANDQITLTYQITIPTNPIHLPLYNAAFLEDGAGGAWERAIWLIVNPFRCYLPLVLK